jgi:hypothetical protein
MFITPSLHFSCFIGLVRLIQRTPESPTGLVRSETEFQRLQPGSRGLHRTSSVPDWLPESFHRILERSTRLIRWPQQTCLVKNSPMTPFKVGAINRLPPAPEIVAHSQETKNTPNIQFLSSLSSP